MAKRKRLSPIALSANPDTPLETKAVPGWSHARPPIADVSGDAARQAALEEVTAELQSARAGGRMVLSLALDAVDATHLVRDRVEMDPEELATLSDSLRDRGQQAPIEVVDLGGGRYGLISGWRRLTALRALYETTSDPAFGTVKALQRSPEDHSAAYKAMVEENEIRANLSFYERARIAVKAAEQGIFPNVNAAVQSLFSAARAPKRSKIINFAGLVEALDDVLRFPAAIPEKVGLALQTRLQEVPGFRAELRAALTEAAPESAQAERAVLDQALRGALKGRAAASAPKPSTAPLKGAEIAPGLALKAGRGAVTLQGAAVDTALVEDLKAWLAARLAQKG